MLGFGVGTPHGLAPRGRCEVREGARFAGVSVGCTEAAVRVLAAEGAAPKGGRRRAGWPGWPGRPTGEPGGK